MRARSEKPDKNSTSRFRIICPPFSPAPTRDEDHDEGLAVGPVLSQLHDLRTSLPSMATVCSSMHPSPAAFKRVSGYA